MGSVWVPDLAVLCPPRWCDEEGHGDGPHDDDFRSYDYRDGRGGTGVVVEVGAVIHMKSEEFKASLKFRLGGLDRVSFRHRNVHGKVLVVIGCIGEVCGEGRIPFGSLLSSQMAEKAALEVLSELKKKMGV